MKTPKKTHEAVVSDGTLTITGEDLKDWKNFTLFSNGPTKITVYLPKTQYDALSIQEHTGDIDLAKDFTFKTITIKASTGDIDCYASADKINVSLSTGDIRMTNVLVADTMTIIRTTGDVKFDKCDAGEITVNTTTGDVTGSLRSDKVFIVRSNTGDIDVPETTTGGKCKITTDTGDIEIKVK